VVKYTDSNKIGGRFSNVLSVTDQIAQSLKVKNLGVSYHFLGFLIHLDEYGIRLSQEQYTNTVIERFGYEKSHGKRTPFNEGTANECAVRCQCESAEKYKQNFKLAASQCTYAPYDVPEIDFPASVGSAMFLGTRTRRDLL
jgi:hypothetical protein